MYWQENECVLQEGKQIVNIIWFLSLLRENPVTKLKLISGFALGEGNKKKPTNQKSQKTNPPKNQTPKSVLMDVNSS